MLTHLPYDTSTFPNLTNHPPGNRMALTKDSWQEERLRIDGELVDAEGGAEQKAIAEAVG
jgi:hypothetical protein